MGTRERQRLCGSLWDISAGLPTAQYHKGQELRPTRYHVTLIARVGISSTSLRLKYFSLSFLFRFFSSLFNNGSEIVGNMYLEMRYKDVKKKKETPDHLSLIPLDLIVECNLLIVA